MNLRASAILLATLLIAAPALADEPKPDDTVSFDLTAEDWVTAKAAHVTVNVEASVSATNAASMRNEMTKAVNDAAKADWKLVGFNRTQDQTGMERWSVTFEARVPETALTSLTEGAKKASKAGMQIKVGNVDFQPSREEMESARAALRTKIYKQAGEQLTALNAALPGRPYRIAQIVFETDTAPAPVRMLRAKVMAAGDVAMSSPTYAPESAPMGDVSTKLVLDAHVVFATTPPAPARP